MTIAGKEVNFFQLIMNQERPRKIFAVKKGERLERFILWLATGSYSGYFPLAPGTAGTGMGVLVYFLFSSYPAPIYLLSTAATFFLAWWAAERAEAILGRRDSPRIVIDEVVGYLITMAFLPLSIPAAIGGFLFFRIFDIIKPPPAGTINRQKKGGLAVVLDDAVAGIYANLSMQLIICFYPDFFQRGIP